MQKRVDMTRARSVCDIAPLIASNGKRIEFGWQRERSEKALVACRMPRLQDWLLASVPIGVFYGMLIAIAAIVATFSHYGTGSDEALSATRYAGMAAFTFALVASAALYRVSRFRAWRKACIECGTEERAWHERFLAAYPKVQSFDKRLDALRHFSQNAEPGADIDEEVVRKYADERDALDRELRTLYREQALRLFEKAVDESSDGRYRDTRDVTDLLFVHRARHDDADRELGALTAIDEPSHIRVTGTVPVSRQPREDVVDEDEEDDRAPDTLRSQRA
jgi:hypothetical protein